MTKRILVVEDQEDRRGVLRDLLSGASSRQNEKGGTRRELHVLGGLAGAWPLAAGVQ
jgi:CheY-like chemotaxis protein